MSTRTGIDTAIVSKLAADHQELFIAVKAEFDTSNIRVWSGKDDITISSETYLGAGTFLSMGDIEDNQDIASSGLQVVLSGMDATVLSYALNEDYQNRPITVFLGFLSAGSSDVVGTLILFKGRMISLEVVDTPEGARVRIDAENRLLDLRRPSNLRYTKESQNFLFSGDVGLNRVNSLMDKEIIWGRTSTSAGDGGGKSDMNDINDRYPPQRK